MDQSWTELADLNTARGCYSGQDFYTSALVYGGDCSTTGKTESWNGSAWTEVADMATARHVLVLRRSNAFEW